MQYSSIFTILALAMTAIAAPSEKVVRAGGGDTTIGSCNSSNSNVCCTSGLLGVLNCIAVLGKNCEGSAYCCSDKTIQNGVVNLDASCVEVL
ncbi:hypothetical protein N657DRAFT_685404 [Parathielavia appendiculata]|uniref:Hydrophobin n=1 Tax=Parathielavia appendiculata TaxID=2587402 RepID=A0AAN6YYB8_9PEZI|nr:hypothetical protein N657DRAFT_685404 [Parathielavia appendiculata]